MLVGGYNLDLYCDTPGCGYQARNPRERHPSPDQFQAETGAQCRKRARKIGWRLDLKRYKAYCPWCNGRKP